MTTKSGKRLRALDGIATEFYRDSRVILRGTVQVKTICRVSGVTPRGKTIIEKDYGYYFLSDSGRIQLYAHDSRHPRNQRTRVHDGKLFETKGALDEYLARVGH